MKSEKFVTIPTEAFVLQSDFIYVSAMNDNVFVKYNYRNSKTECICRFKGDRELQYRIHCSADIIDDIIYFFPDRGRHIHRFCLSKDAFLEPISIKTECISRYIYGFAWNDKLVCIKCAPNNEVVIYSKEGSIVNTIHICSGNNNCYVQRSIFLEGNVVYLVNNMDNCVFCIDLFTGDVRRIIVNDRRNKTKGFGTIYKINDLLFLSSDEEILSYDISNDTVSVYNDFPDEYGMVYLDESGELRSRRGFYDVKGVSEQPFSCCFKWKDGLVFLPGRVNMGLYLDLNKGTICRYEIIDEQETIDSLKRIGRITHNHYINNEANGTDYILSTATNTIYRISDAYDVSSTFIGIDCVLDKMFSGMNFFEEDKEGSLDNYIRAVSLIKNDEVKIRD